MKTAGFLASTAVALALGIGAAWAQPAGMHYSNGVLVDENGMTLYTFDNDEQGMSNCYDDCAANWPPLEAAADAEPEGDFSVVARDDGTQQWAYEGMPLYLWVNDAEPGDMTGDGVGGVWHVIEE